MGHAAFSQLPPVGGDVLRDALDQARFVGGDNCEYKIVMAKPSEFNLQGEPGGPRKQIVYHFYIYLEQSNSFSRTSVFSAVTVRPKSVTQRRI